MIDFNLILLSLLLFESVAPSQYLLSVWHYQNFPFTSRYKHDVSQASLILQRNSNRVMSGNQLPFQFLHTVTSCCAKLKVYSLSNSFWGLAKVR